jgi:hypothetical protein
MKMPLGQFTPSTFSHRRRFVVAPPVTSPLRHSRTRVPSIPLALLRRVVVGPSLGRPYPHLPRPLSRIYPPSNPQRAPTRAYARRVSRGVASTSSCLPRPYPVTSSLRYRGQAGLGAAVFSAARSGRRPGYTSPFPRPDHTRKTVRPR